MRLFVSPLAFLNHFKRTAVFRGEHSYAFDTAKVAELIMGGNRIRLEFIVFDKIQNVARLAI